LNPGYNVLAAVCTGMSQVFFVMSVVLSLKRNCEKGEGKVGKMGSNERHNILREESGGKYFLLKFSGTTQSSFSK
jgi:hypothetical protein